MITLEIALDDVGGAAAARAGGAHRLELCAELTHGGTTPTLGFVAAAVEDAPDVALQVLVRPRSGDFVYTPAEVDVMVTDIAAVMERCRDSAASSAIGFTLGALTSAGTVDEAAMERLVAACGSAPVVFHKAFDSVPDKVAALSRLADLGVAKVLTSGGEGSATAHLAELTALVEAAGERIDIVVGGGVRAHNAAEIVRATGARELHCRATRQVASANAAGTTKYDHGTRSVTDAATVAAVLAAVSPAT